MNRRGKASYHVLGDAANSPSLSPQPGLFLFFLYIYTYVLPTRAGCWPKAVVVDVELDVAGGLAVLLLSLCQVFLSGFVFCIFFALAAGWILVNGGWLLPRLLPFGRASRFCELRTGVSGFGE